MSTVLLYLGLGLVTMGLVITLVGVGDKGFTTFELKLLGPGLVSCGGVMFMVRLLVCTVGMGREEVGKSGGEETGRVEEKMFQVESIEKVKAFDDDIVDCADEDEDSEEEKYYFNQY